MPAALRLYELLLRLYPREFRDRFAADMALDFAESSVEVRAAGGTLGLTAHWGRAFANVAVTLLVAGCRSGVPAIAGTAALVTCLIWAAAVQWVPTQAPVYLDATHHGELLLLLMVLAVLVPIIGVIVLNCCVLMPLTRRPRRTRRV